MIRRGYYPFRTTPDELAELEADTERLDDLFHKEMLGTVERWMAMAAEKLAGQPQRVFVCPGNDDQFDVDEILAAATRVELAEGRVVDVGDYQMASTGWSNPDARGTPTARSRRTSSSSGSGASPRTSRTRMSG